MSDPLGKLITVAVIGGVAFLGYEAYQCSQKHGGDLSLTTIMECLLGDAADVGKDVANTVAKTVTTEVQNFVASGGGTGTDTPIGCGIEKMIDGRFGYNKDTQQCMKYYAKGGENQPTQNLTGAQVCKSGGGWFDQSVNVTGRCCNKNDYRSCQEINVAKLITTGTAKIPTRTPQVNCEMGFDPTGNTWDSVNNQCYFKSNVTYDPNQVSSWETNCNNLQGYHWNSASSTCMPN